MDIKEELLNVCSDFHPVDRIWVDSTSKFGYVWVKFRRNGGSEAAAKVRDLLHEKFFDERKITVNFVPEHLFNAKVAEAL